MKRTSLVVLVCVAAAIVALPPVFGMLTEARFRQRIDAMNEAGRWSLEVNAFERGWFGSTASIDAGLGADTLALLGYPPSGEDLPEPGLEWLEERLPFRIDVAHGPVALRGGLHIGLARVTASLDPAAPDMAELADTLGIPHLFEFRGGVGLLGGLRFDADMPAIDYASDAGTGYNEVVLSGLRLDGRLNGSNFLAQLEIDSFAWSNPVLAVSVDAIEANIDSEFPARFESPAESELLIGRALVVNRTVGGEPVFEAGNIAVRGESDLVGAGTLLAGSASYSSDYLNLGERFRFTDAEIVLGLDNLDVDAMNEINALQPQIDEMWGETEALMPVLMPVFLQLLAAEPTASFDPIGFALDNEPFEAIIQFRTHADALPDLATGLAGGPELLIPAVSVEAEASASRAFALRVATEFVRLQLGVAGPGGFPAGVAEQMIEAQAGAMLGAAVAQGFLVEDGESYRVAFEYANGEVLLNGGPLPWL